MNACPVCKLVSPPDAVRCDCGYDFISRKVERSYDPILAKKLTEPLSSWESIFTVFYGAGLGLLGLIFVWSQASKFEEGGYVLKRKKSWQLYWLGIGLRLLLLVSIVIGVRLRSH